MLTVQPPELLGADIPELRDMHFPPFMGRLKRWPLFKQDDVGPHDPEAEAYLVPDVRRHARLAERAEAPIHLGFLDLRERHSVSSAMPSPGSPRGGRIGQLEQCEERDRSAIPEDRRKQARADGLSSVDRNNGPAAVSMT